jgi:tryptophan synthase beta subunit
MIGISAPTLPDDRGRFGDFGGRYVPEVLIRALAWLADHPQIAAPGLTGLP